MTTDQKIIPSADAVFNDLVPVVTATYDAFEQATFDARDYFERKKKTIDPHLFAHLARYNALEVLKEKGNIVSEVNDLVWKLKPLANSGIYLAYQQYRVRVLKFKRDVPYPGHSQSRQKYYEQDWEQMRFDWPLLDDSLSYLNLLLLWRVNEKYDLIGFSLACPQGAGTTRDSVKLYWNKVIPMEYLQNILLVPTSEKPPETPPDLPVEENIEIEIERDFEE